MELVEAKHMNVPPNGASMLRYPLVGDSSLMGCICSAWPLAVCFRYWKAVLVALSGIDIVPEWGWIFQMHLNRLCVFCNGRTGLGTYCG